MLNSASGSANPATSLSALWAYLQPALDHIVKSSTNEPDGKAPAIDFGLYAGIHSACYNYFTLQTDAAHSAASSTKTAASGSDIYHELDIYFADAARELALGVPQDDSTLIHYIVSTFNRYTAGARSANRLLNYVNRHYVKRAIDEDKGWLRLNDVFESVVKNMTLEDTREKFSKRLREKRVEELKKWGYEDGCSSAQAAEAEACAEAASSLDRVVNVSSLAHRRFRTDFIEPLLAAPKIKGKSKAKHKIPKVSGETLPTRPKGRLARAAHDLLEAQDMDEDRIGLLLGLANTLRTIGVRPSHPFCKKLDKFVEQWKLDNPGTQ